MKKSVVLATLLCLALSCSAFALPLYASVGLKAETSRVMEKETPKEYMEDFNAEGKQNKGQLVNTIFLSDSQLGTLETAAVKAFKETLGVEIPKELKFEYNTLEFEGIRITLKWTDDKEQSTEKDAVSFYADFKMSDVSSPAILNAISVINGYDLKKLDGLKKQGMDSLKKDFDVTVPDEYFVRIRVAAHFIGESQDISVEFAWAENKITDFSKDNPAYAYNIVFDKVDLLKNTGRITAIENTVKMFSIDESSIAKFTSGQEKYMLEAAKKFLEAKEIGIGNLISSRQIGDRMWFAFDSVTENHSIRTVVDTYISKDLDILGYIY